MAENQRFEIAARPHLAVDLLVANLSGTPCPVKAAAAEGGEVAVLIELRHVGPQPRQLTPSPPQYWYQKD